MSSFESQCRAGAALDSYRGAVQDAANFLVVDHYRAPILDALAAAHAAISTSKVDPCKATSLIEQAHQTLRSHRMEAVTEAAYADPEKAGEIVLAALGLDLLIEGLAKLAHEPFTEDDDHMAAVRSALRAHAYANGG